MLCIQKQHNKTSLQFNRRNNATIHFQNYYHLFSNIHFLDLGWQKVPNNIIMSEKNETLSTNFLDAIKLERESDIEVTNALLARLSSKKLAEKGLAVLSLEISNTKTGLGGRLLVELKNSSMIKGDTTEIDAGGLRVGDIVKMEKMSSTTASGNKRKSSSSSKKKKDLKSADGDTNDENNLNSIDCIIIRISTTQITVALDDSENNDDRHQDVLLGLEAERVWLVKVSNSVTYKRMELTMRRLKELKESEMTPLIQLLLGISNFIPPSSEAVEKTLIDTKFHNLRLNNSQKHAISFAMNSNLSIIHGPPGTGKTYTLIELIQQLAESNGRILVCAASNIAVDTIIERLDKIMPYGKMIRIGHPARLLPSIQKHSLDYLSKSYEGEILSDIKKEITENLKKVKKTKSYRDRRVIYQDIKFLRKDLRLREKKILSELIMNAKIIVSTLHGAGSRELTDAKELLGNTTSLFDVLIIDEVSQSLEPQCWIPIINHNGIKKLVLAGDNKQLPPTIKLDDHDLLSLKHCNVQREKISKFKQCLEKTLFDRLVTIHNEKDIKKLLNIQYRMNDAVVNFVSKELYNDQLKTFEGIENQLLKDLQNVDENDDTDTPVIWYDTQGGDFMEQTDDDNLGGSKFNENEALIAKMQVENLIKSKVSQESIGIISPYNSQVSILKKLIHVKYPAVEISTIDGFQGREKDVIILSLVRSNDNKEIGFLKDERRLNVAITRHKYQLIIIGDIETLSEQRRSKFLKNLSSWGEDNSEIRYPNLDDIL